MHWRRNPFDFGGAGVTPVIMAILFAKAWGKKTSIHGNILGGGGGGGATVPPQPPWFLRLCGGEAFPPAGASATADSLQELSLSGATHVYPINLT